MLFIYVFPTWHSSAAKFPLSLNSPNLPSISKAPCSHLSFSHLGTLNFPFCCQAPKKTIFIFTILSFKLIFPGWLPINDGSHHIECVSTTRCNPNCMLGINLVSRCRSWWGSWGGRAPGSRGGVASKNLSGTAAASAAPPTLLFKLHLNPLDFLLGKINSHLPQTSMRWVGDLSPTIGWSVPLVILKVWGVWLCVLPPTQIGQEDQAEQQPGAATWQEILGKKVAV